MTCLSRTTRCQERPPPPLHPFYLFVIDCLCSFCSRFAALFRFGHFGHFGFYLFLDFRFAFSAVSICPEEGLTLDTSKKRWAVDGKRFTRSTQLIKPDNRGYVNRAQGLRGRKRKRRRLFFSVYELILPSLGKCLHSIAQG